MENPIVAVLPFAVGAMISPFVLTVQAFILIGAVQPKVRGWFFTLGCAAFLMVYVVAVYIGFSRLPISGHPSPYLQGAEIALAILLVVLAIRTYVHKKPPGEEHKGRLQQVIAHAKPWSFFLVGLGVMATDLSSLIIIIPGVRVVQETQASMTLQVAALLVVLLLTLVPALVPVGLATIFGHRADEFLVRLNHWVNAHTKLITAAICLILAAFLFYGAVK